MPLIPFRNLASKGIIKDLPPYQLDASSFSDGSNVWFHGGVVSRSPSFRTVADALSFTPYAMGSIRQSSGQDQVFMMGAGQTCYLYSSGAVTNVTPAAYTPATSARAITTTVLAQVAYLNDPANTPFYYGPGGGLFAALPGWDATWRCRSLRAFQNYLVALNVTKGGNYQGNLVKWSDLSLNGVPPASWDHTDTTKSAGENPLEALTSPLVDGLGLRNALCLYSSDEVWAMEPTGDNLIFAFRRLFKSGGMMTPNCGAEVDGKHYVLAPNDVYVHNGITKSSVIDSKNRKYLFGNLNTAAASACFVTYLPKHNSILVGYPTGTSESAIGVGNGCNKGAVLDLNTGSWTFIDLPNVHGCALASAIGSGTYGTTTSTYTTVGGSYWNQQALSDSHILMVSEALSPSITQSRLLGFDFAQRGELPFPLCTELTYPAYVERAGIDLDDAGSDLATSKLLKRLLIQARRYGTNSFTIKVGSADFPEGPYRYAADRTFDPVSQYKVDMLSGGRYLSIRFTMTALDDFDLTGFDAEVSPNGSR